MLLVALFCLVASAPWTGVNGQGAEPPALAPTSAQEPAPGPGIAEGPSFAAAPGAGLDGDTDIVNTMEADLDEMIMKEAMGPSVALPPGTEDVAQGPAPTPAPSRVDAALSPETSSRPRSVGPPGVSSPPSPSTVPSPVSSSPADDAVTTADRIFQEVKDGDTEGASEEIVTAVAGGEVDMVTAAAVLARDNGLSSEMAQALSATLLKGVRPSQIRRAFAIVGSG